VTSFEGRSLFLNHPQQHPEFRTLRTPHNAIASPTTLKLGSIWDVWQHDDQAHRMQTSLATQQLNCGIPVQRLGRSQLIKQHLNSELTRQAQGKSQVIDIASIVQKH
jgi:hypothetical protein